MSAGFGSLSENTGADLDAVSILTQSSVITVVVYTVHIVWPSTWHII